jgi:hypothetical protein
MKTKLIVVLALSTLVLGAVCAWQAAQLGSAKVRQMEADRMLTEQREARAEEERRSRALERRQAELNQQLFDISAVVGSLRQAGAQRATNGPPGSASAATAQGGSEDAGLLGKDMGKMLSKMMSDPAMKEMMRPQQKAMISTMYGSLFKELNLTAEERLKLSELLLDQQMKTTEASMGLFDEGGLAAVSQSVSAQQKESEEQIKGFLGEERFAQYQEYQKTIGERMQLDQLRQQMDGSGTPVQDEQLKQLLALMKEERERTPPPFSGSEAGAGDLEKSCPASSWKSRWRGKRR